MANYSYLVMDSKGKEKKGTIDAEDLEKAREKLKAEGNLIMELEEANVLSQDVNISFLERKPKVRQMAVFCRQFTSIIDAGVTVTDALGMLSKQTENKMLANALAECKMSIEKGSTLADAMRLYPQLFSNLFVTLVEAGEASGSLGVSFDRMGTQFEKDAKLKGIIKKASIYPIVVCVVAVIVLIVMLTFVVPQFEELLSSLDTELPMLTKIVMAASKAFINRWYVVAVIVVLLVAGIRYYKKTEGGTRLLGKIGMKAPLIGPLTIKSASARMCRTMATLTGAGIPMIQALDIVSKTMSNVFFKEALENSKDDVAMGSSLSESLERSGVFPPLVYQMIKIGEETGDTEKMLNKLAEYYEDEVEEATSQLMAALEPMIIIVLALMIGVIVGSVMLPMASMYEALDKL